MTIDELEAKLAELTPKERELWEAQAASGKVHKEAPQAWDTAWSEIKDLEAQLKIERAVAERLTKSL